MLQSVHFKKSLFTLAGTKKWVNSHDLRPMKPVHITDTFYEYRISPPKKGIYYSKYIAPGILFVFVEWSFGPLRDWLISFLRNTKTCPLGITYPFLSFLGASFNFFKSIWNNNYIHFSRRPTFGPKTCPQTSKKGYVMPRGQV